MKHRVLQIGDQIRINYQPAKGRKQRIPVTVITSVSGYDLVAADSHGRLYTTWWEELKNKSDGKYSLFFRHWRRYQGIYYLRRGLLYALVQAEQIKIPTLAELQEFCRDKNAEIALLQGDVAQQLFKLGQQFNRLQEFLTGRRRQTLQESQQQLSFFLLLRDSLGRLNVGVLRARLTAIDHRFTKELKHLLGWTPHYAARLSATRALQKQLERQVGAIQTSLKAMMTHLAFRTGQTSAKQIKGITQALRRQIVVLRQLAAIKPFDRWAAYCIDDLQSASCRVENSWFDAAKTHLNRAQEAIKLRILGFELEEILAAFSLEMLLNKVNRQHYQQTLVKLCSQFALIDETGFAQPVCQEVLVCLQAARKTVEKSDWPLAKQKLKQAAALL